MYNNRANKNNNAGNGVNSQDQLLSPSTDELEDFTWVLFPLYISLYF